jgi:hypothetical protein
MSTQTWLRRGDIKVESFDAQSRGFLAEQVRADSLGDVRLGATEAFADSHGITARVSLILWRPRSVLPGIAKNSIQWTQCLLLRVMQTWPCAPHVSAIGP